jgi:lysophospholipase L1-like esterase/pectate lyase
LATALLAASGPASAQPAEAERAAVLLVGDSTMAPRTGYGDALCQRLEPGVACLNLGRGGRSTLSYRAEGLWDRVLARLRSGSPALKHHVLIQFGHNDQPGKPGRSTDLATEFPANLARYVEETRAAGAVPVLVTPLTRRSFRGSQLNNDLEPWADAVRAVAKRMQVTVLDLNAASAQRVQALGQAGADEMAMAPPPPAGQAASGPSAGFDRTHVGPKGACVFADLMAQAIASQLPALAAAVRPGEDCASLPPPGPVSVQQELNRATYDLPGWAVGTLGGRGGRVLRVTTLADSGPGSLRAAVQASGPRLVVFEVGGVIDLQGHALEVRNPFITLAGQTAPAPGITLIKGATVLRTHDVIVQHLAFRPGEYGRKKRGGGDQDGLSTAGGAHHVIVDHCSFSWATDENLSISGPRFDGADLSAWQRNTSFDITYSHNLISEGLAHSVHPKGEHSKGSLVHDNATGVLLHGNLFASNNERNALFKGGVHAAMVNNLIVNPGARAVHYNLLASEWAGHPHEVGKIALVGNVLRHGPSTRPGTPLFSLGGQGSVELHLQDNLAADASGNPVPQTGRYTLGDAALLTPTEPYLPAGMRALPATLVEAAVLRAAGARPWSRDAIDSLLLSEVAEGRGAIIDSEAEHPLGHLHNPQQAPTRAAFVAADWNLADMSPRAGWDSLFAARQAAAGVQRGKAGD